MVSWINPDAGLAEKGWDDYISEGIDFALDTIEERTGEKEINAVGYCVGGTLLASALALHAQQDNERIRSATLLAAQQGVWLRQRQEDARPLPAPLAAMHSELAATFPPLIEDRALEGELRLCLEQIRNRHWRLYA